MTYYAWTVIQNGVERDTTDPTVILKRTTIPYGEEVSADSLDIDDAEFQALIDSGAVRQYAPPDMPSSFSGSPLDYLRLQARQAEELSLSQNLGGYNIGGVGDEAARLMGEVPVPDGVEPGTGPTEEATGV